jgi:hypothetical protein
MAIPVEWRRPRLVVQSCSIREHSFVWPQVLGVAPEALSVRGHGVKDGALFPRFWCISAHADLLAGRPQGVLPRLHDKPAAHDARGGADVHQLRAHSEEDAGAGGASPEGPPGVVTPGAFVSHMSSRGAALITETNRTLFALFGLQNRTFRTYLMTNSRVLNVSIGCSPRGAAITELNRICLVLFDMNNEIRGPYLAAMDRILVSVMSV